MHAQALSCTDSQAVLVGYSARDCTGATTSTTSRTNVCQTDDKVSSYRIECSSAGSISVNLAALVALMLSATGLQKLFL